MPIKSRAQRRKFAELLLSGQITPEQYERWNREAGSAELPEHVKPRKRKTARKAKRKTARKVKRKTVRKAKRASRPAKKSVRKKTRKTRTAKKRRTRKPARA